MVGFQARMKATFGEINQEQVSEPRSVPSDKIDNRIFERRQTAVQSSITPTQSTSYQTIHRIHSQQHQHRFIDNPNHQQIHQPSAPITATPVQQRSTSNDMDIDFARRGPLTTAERQQRFSQGLCLVCGQSGP
ncbi:hypothetical protein BASA83_011964 [Batrachochytrium salamandrivorans]|nr:hypothetical protein BASA83_011964 [Batrachochytrium salamandrivorans]